MINKMKNIKTANFIMWLGFCLLVVSLVLAPVIALFTGAMDLGSGAKTGGPAAYYTILGSFVGLSVLLLVAGFFLKRKFKKLEAEQGVGAPDGSGSAVKTGKVSLAGFLLALLGAALYFTPSLGVLPSPTYMLFYIFGGGWIGLVLFCAGTILIIRKLILGYKAKKI